MTEFDVVVIGGGSTGTAVARDCAMRGMKTLLLERDDIASATVGTCAGMISSGFKYYNEPEVMDICSEEVTNFRKIARHIVMKNPILFPLLDLSDFSSSDGTSGVEEYAKRVEERGVPPFLFITPEASLELEPMLSLDVIGSGYIEEYFIDPFRLCMLQAIDAINHGATIKTYCEVTEIGFNNNSNEIVFFNRITGEIERVKGKVVINASGPWATKIAQSAGLTLDLRLNKGAHVILDRRVVNIGITIRSLDRRWIYMYPHENTTLIGTTALDTWENPDELVTSQDEIEYLLGSFESVVPSIKQARIIRTMEGVRPMAPVWKVPEDEVTRGYEIVDHEFEGAAGFLSFTGGKLVMCRRMAEDVTDIVCKKLGIVASCETHQKPLPGNDDDIDVLSFAKEFNMSTHALERLRARRGTEIRDILELTKEHPEWKSYVCTCEPVIEAELRFSIRNEFPQTLNDIRRRLRLGTGPCQGTFCTFKAAAILAEEMELNGSQFQTDILDFL
ncbi:MAG: FAD-dependent oxidoreductase, partial [Candidatus Thorarchaeota archaeon]